MCTNDKLLELFEQFQASSETRSGEFLEKNFSHEELSQFRYQVPIVSSNEKLVEISADILRFDPHPYESLGAPYGNASPYFLRESVASGLDTAQRSLQELHQGYSLKIFDGYRPIAVQDFMIQHEYKKLASVKGIVLDSQEVNEELMYEVLEFWAAPSEDLTKPPPHSTGAAVDLTIVDEQGRELDMGTAVDAISPQSLPSAFAGAQSEEEVRFHKNRELLCQVMEKGGFRRLPTEWWHFSFDDQFFALMEYLEGKESSPEALFGRI